MGYLSWAENQLPLLNTHTSLLGGKDVCCIQEKFAILNICKELPTSSMLYKERVPNLQSLQPEAHTLQQGLATYSPLSISGPWNHLIQPADEGDFSGWSFAQLVVIYNWASRRSGNAGGQVLVPAHFGPELCHSDLLPQKDCQLLHWKIQRTKLCNKGFSFFILRTRISGLSISLPLTVCVILYSNTYLFSASPYPCVKIHTIRHFEW